MTSCPVGARNLFPSWTNVSGDRSLRHKILKRTCGIGSSCTGSSRRKEKMTDAVTDKKQKSPGPNTPPWNIAKNQSGTAAQTRTPFPSITRKQQMNPSGVRGRKLCPHSCYCRRFAWELSWKRCYTSSCPGSPSGNVPTPRAFGLSSTPEAGTNSSCPPNITDSVIAMFYAKSVRERQAPIPMASATCTQRSPLETPLRFSRIGLAIFRPVAVPLGAPRTSTFEPQPQNYVPRTHSPPCSRPLLFLTNEEMQMSTYMGILALLPLVWIAGQLGTRVDPC